MCVCMEVYSWNLCDVGSIKSEVSRTDWKAGNSWVGAEADAAALLLRPFN